MNSGKLELIIGNMFSGKSTELIRRIKRELSIHKKILVINYIDDNRYYDTEVISTHDKTTFESLKIKNFKKILNNINQISSYDSIFIDEGQFFTDLYESVKYLTDTLQKHVIVAGLDGDSNRSIFGQMLSLIPIADNILKLKAYCIKCSNRNYAPFTKKIAEFNNPINSIDIGGIDKYIPVCRYHYLTE